MGKFWLKPKKPFPANLACSWDSACLFVWYLSIFSPPLGPWWSNFHKLHAAYIGFVSSTIWFQSWVSSSIRLEVMKGQKNCWILPFSHLLHLEHGQNKDAMAFRQCHIVKYLISTSHGTLDCPLGTIWEPEGPWGAYKMAKKCLK